MFMFKNLIDEAQTSCMRTIVLKLEPSSCKMPFRPVTVSALPPGSLKSRSSRTVALAPPSRDAR